MMGKSIRRESQERGGRKSHVRGEEDLHQPLQQFVFLSGNGGRLGDTKRKGGRWSYKSLFGTTTQEGGAVLREKRRRLEEELEKVRGWKKKAQLHYPQEEGMCCGKKFFRA